MCSPPDASQQKTRRASQDHWISFIHGYSIWQQLSLAVGATTPQFLVYHIKCLLLQLLLPTYLLSRVTTDDGDHSWLSCPSHPWSPAAIRAHHLEKGRWCLSGASRSVFRGCCCDYAFWVSGFTIVHRSCRIPDDTISRFTYFSFDWFC